MKNKRLKLNSSSGGIKSSSGVIKRKHTDKSDEFEAMRRYLCPPPEDFPLLKTHYPGEWFQRIDGNSIVQRWKDDTGTEHHIFMYYPAEGNIKQLEAMESDWTIRNDYFLLLWKRLNLFGIARYRDVPCDVTSCEFDKYLSKATNRLKLNVKPVKRLKLNVCQRFKLKVKA
jgi:hypothetical protein